MLSSTYRHTADEAGEGPVETVGHNLCHRRFVTARVFSQRFERRDRSMGENLTTTGEISASSPAEQFARPAKLSMKVYAD